MNKPTRRQEEILECIERYWSIHGEAPGIVEIAEEFNVWPNAIQCHVDALRKKGWLEPGRGRGGKSSLYPIGLRNKIKAIYAVCET